MISREPAGFGITFQPAAAANGEHESMAEIQKSGEGSRREAGKGAREKRAQRRAESSEVSGWDPEVEKSDEKDQKGSQHKGRVKSKPSSETIQSWSI